MSLPQLGLNIIPRHSGAEILIFLATDAHGSNADSPTLVLFILNSVS